MEETIPKPVVVSYCKICLGPRNLKPLSGQEVVSPSGVAHYGMDGGNTLCGHDATGDNWWWPL